MNDLMGDQVTVSVAGLSSAVGKIKGGLLKALAVTGDSRSPQLPYVPAVSEIKPGLVMETWVGISLPPKTPQPIVDRLVSLIQQAMKEPDIQTQLSEQGVKPVFEAPAAITARMADSQV